MGNIKVWIDEFLKEHKLKWSDIQKVHVGDQGWDCDDKQGAIVMKPQEAKKFLNYEFDDGYGGENGHNFHIYLKDWILAKGCYDGSEWLFSIPRKPNKNIRPASVGGG